MTLAYVALEGPTPRAVLSGLLWPGSPEATARNNLRQLKRRLRLACGGTELLEGEDPLQLSAHVDVDALRLEHSLPPEGEGEGELLAGLHFDDSPELARWLDGARARVEGRRRRARAAELARREAAGDVAGALALAEAWAGREPESEEAGHEVMRLHYLLGQRGAALESFARLERTLERELGVAPMPRTLALARKIEQGIQLPGGSGLTRPLLPLSVLRPPVLAGREEAWRALQEGRERGQVLFIVGEPGVGKSRLMQDFAESQGRWKVTEGRPGDREVPFACAVRNFRTWRAARPDAELPPWIRRELSRLMPELAEPGEAPPLVPRELDRVRLFDALIESSLRFNAGIDTLITDDMQFLSEAELSISEYCFSRMYPSLNNDVYQLGGIRRGEGLPMLWAMVRRLEAAGVARVVELPPLNPRGVRTLLEGLELPGAERHAERLARYTGGNPLYVVETVKHLMEQGLWEGEWPERLPPPGRVGPLIQRRLEALSPAALRLARVAALARTQFTHALASAVLEVGALQVGEATVELEAAQVMLGEHFTHDLIQEAVASTIPESLRRMLHLRLAQVLEERRAPPVMLAHHWFEAGESARALPALMRAATEDEAVLQPEATADLYARAAALLIEAGRYEEALQARTREARCRQRLS